MQYKNVILAAVLSMAFIFLWSTFVVPRFTPKPVPAPVGMSSGSSTVPAAPSTMSPLPAATSGLTPTAAASTESPDVTLQDDQDAVVLRPRGGAVKSWNLIAKGQNVDLVDTPTADLLPLVSFPNVVFKITTNGHNAVMEGTVQKGLRLTKTLSLSAEGHLHNLTYQFQNTTDQPIELKNWEWGWGPGLGTAETERKDNGGLIRAITLGPLKVHVLKENQPTDFGRWAAIDNRYFLVAFIPTAQVKPQIYVNGAKDQEVLHLVENTLVPAHGQAVLDYQLYAGPKGYTALKKYNRGLEEAVDFGFFSPVGRVILSAIYWLKGLTGNYGWAIILMTVCLQILLLPLTIKSFKAALGMKKLQPRIAALQKQYKGDPKRLNVEMMNLYKNSGTNPFGGCLPMLLQLPIFWALFTTLRNAYELRGSPFIFWIHDLSVADPYRVLPIIMGVAMFFQQRMTGAVTDPTQRQMMTIMPVMFTFMFMNFPAGLVLYWLTNNVMTMTFQYSYQRYTNSSGLQPPDSAGLSVH